MLMQASAAVAILAGNIVEQHAVGHTPGCVLWIGLRIKIDDRRANRRGNMHRTGVVLDQQVRAWAQCA